MAPAGKRPFALVTGIHRSGTTLTGRLLAQYDSLHVIHEPLNKEYGLRGVDHVYPCDLSADQEQYYLGLLERFLDGKAGLIRRVASDPPMKGLARAVIGGRTRYDLLRYRLRRLVRNPLLPVLKDPFAFMLSRSLCERGCSVVALVRHPAAIWLSVKRMGWRFNYASFAYPGIFEDMGVPVLQLRELEALPEVEKFSWLWFILYTYLGRIREIDRLLIVRHEDLCVKPYEELGRMESFLDLAPNAKARDYIATHLFGAPTTVTGSQLHVLERNAKELATAWQRNIEKDDESRISRICGTLVESYYGCWRPI